MCRYYVRDQSPADNETQWYAESWYFGTGESTPHFFLTSPPFLLTFAHLIIWVMVFFLLCKCGHIIGSVTLRYFVVVPLIMLTLLTIIMCLFGLDFRESTTGIDNATIGEAIKNMGFHYQGVTKVGREIMIWTLCH